MDRKQIIIISVTGIFLVLMILIGLTYAYFLTNIIGNEKDKSISVSTDNLELIYNDNSAEIINGSGPLIPKINTEAIDAIGTKKFTVTNNGNTTDYVVIIENVSITKASDGTSTTYATNDFRYKLSCVVKDKSGNILENESCNKIERLEIFPIDGGILVNNDISSNRVHEYTLTLWYLDTGKDQSNDMGKTYQAKINIKDMKAINPFETGDNEVDEVNLAYNIINNALNSKNGTTLVNNSFNKIAVEKPSVVQNFLGVTSDDYGISYYFKGQVTDNYVNFAGMCWRIVRIQGDGSTKLILEDKNEQCNDNENNDLNNNGTYFTGKWGIGAANYGAKQYKASDNTTKNIMSYMIPEFEPTKSMVKLFYDFQTNVLGDYLDKMKSGGWCLDDKGYSKSETSPYTYTLLNEYDYLTNVYYDSFTRIKEGNATGFQPTLKCTGTILDKFVEAKNATHEAPMYVSTITVNEVIFAGGTGKGGDNQYYLINENFTNGYFKTLSPSYFSGTEDTNFYLTSTGGLLNTSVVNPNVTIRPAILLKNGVEILNGGDGTRNNPYVIK